MARNIKPIEYLKRPYNLKKILITGATGFIGGFLVEQAVLQGFEVVVSVRKKSDLSYIKHLTIEYTELDLSSIEKMIPVLSGIQPNYIINNAGLTKAKTQKELDLVNGDYAENLALAAMQAVPNLEKYVYVSSLASYGPAETKNAEIIKNEHTPEPITMYGHSKLKAETKLKAINGLPYIILRPTAVYGPREKDLFTVFKMINNGIAAHSGSGDQKLTFVYIDDLVQFLLAACTTKVTKKCYFVTDGNFYTAKELNRNIALNLNKKTLNFGLPLPILTAVAYVSELVGKISGTIPPLNLDKLNEIKAKNWQCEVLSLYNDLDYNPKTFLPEGIAKTCEWYKKNKWL